jgi:hypothetical protein
MASTTDRLARTRESTAQTQDAHAESHKPVIRRYSKSDFTEEMGESSLFLQGRLLHPKIPAEDRGPQFDSVD